MDTLNHDRFVAGNEELREILRRAQGLEKVAGRVNEQDLEVIGARLLNLTPEIGEASRIETLDKSLQDEVAEYVKNLNTLQHVLAIIRSAPADRRVRPAGPKRHVDGPDGLDGKYLRTA